MARGDDPSTGARRWGAPAPTVWDVTTSQRRGGIAAPIAVWDPMEPGGLTSPPGVWGCSAPPILGRTSTAILLASSTGPGLSLRARVHSVPRGSSAVTPYLPDPGVTATVAPSFAPGAPNTAGWLVINDHPTLPGHRSGPDSHAALLCLGAWVTPFSSYSPHGAAHSPHPSCGPRCRANCALGSASSDPSPGGPISGGRGRTRSRTFAL